MILTPLRTRLILLVHARQLHNVKYLSMEPYIKQNLNVIVFIYISIFYKLCIFFNFVMNELLLDGEKHLTKRCTVWFFRKKFQYKEGMKLPRLLILNNFKSKSHFKNPSMKYNAFMNINSTIILVLKFIYKCSLYFIREIALMPFDTFLHCTVCKYSLVQKW